MSIQDKVEKIKELEEQQKNYEQQKKGTLDEVLKRYNEIGYIPETDIRTILDVDSKVIFTKHQIWQLKEDIKNIQKKQSEIEFGKKSEKRRKAQDTALSILLDTVKKIESSEEPPEKKFLILSETLEKIKEQENYLKTVRGKTWSDFEHLLKQFKPTTVQTTVSTAVGGGITVVRAAQKYFGIDRNEIINWLKNKGLQGQTELELKEAALKMIVEQVKE